MNKTIADLEQYVLSCVFLEPKLLQCLKERLTENSFEVEKHQAIYCALVYFSSEPDSFTIQSLIKALEYNGKLDAAGGEEYVTSLIDVADTVAFFSQIIEELEP